MTYIERIIDAQTGEITERPYTQAEIAEVEKALAASIIKDQNAQTKAIEKAALLEKLGITADEAALLL